MIAADGLLDLQADHGLPVGEGLPDLRAQHQARGGGGQGAGAGAGQGQSAGQQTPERSHRVSRENWTLVTPTLKWSQH